MGLIFVIVRGSVMQRVFTSKLNIPFIPIDDIYSVIEGIINHDPDDSFMLHFLPGDLVIETGFRIPQTHHSQSFSSYREENRSKEKWVRGQHKPPLHDVYDVVQWDDIKNGYSRLKTAVENLEAKQYKLNEFSMGLKPDSCEVSISLAFPKRGEMSLRTSSHNRHSLGFILDRFLDSIPLGRSERGGYAGLTGYA